MRYFAIIEEEQRGPYTLAELAAAGVGPDTYVWAKDMSDWQKARDVAEICRYWRQHIAELNTPSLPALATAEADSKEEERRHVIDDEVDTSYPPVSMLVPSFLLTFFCFPFTGLVAIYYSFKTRQTWALATDRTERGEGKLYSEKEREELRVIAHDYARLSKMWAGITFFLGIIFYAFLGRNVL